MAALKILALTVLNFLAQNALAQRSPTISYISQQQIKDIGGTVELSCSVQYTQDYSVLWIKADPNGGSYSLPISTGSSLILHDSRFALRYDTASSTYTLQIKDIQETDAGFYHCQILISPSNRVSAEVELQVRRPPFISDNSTRSVVVSEGEAVQMECYAGGYPTPRISWRRENDAILPTGGSIYRGNVLKIKSIRKEDRGTYYCVAENGVGRGTKRNIAVEVEFAPVVTVPRPRLGQALQYDMDLVCHVEAYPPPAISWVKDDVLLNKNQHYDLSHFATADEFTDTTLRVITIEKRQYGQYICRAGNKLGTAEGVVELFETVIPVCPPACGQARYGGGAASLSTSSAALILTLIIMVYRMHFPLVFHGWLKKEICLLLRQHVRRYFGNSWTTRYYAEIKADLWCFYAESEEIVGYKFVGYVPLKSEQAVPILFVFCDKKTLNSRKNAQNADFILSVILFDVLCCRATFESLEH